MGSAHEAYTALATGRSCRQSVPNHTSSPDTSDTVFSRKGCFISAKVFTGRMLSMYLRKWSPRNTASSRTPPKNTARRLMATMSSLVSLRATSASSRQP